MTLVEVVVEVTVTVLVTSASWPMVVVTVTVLDAVRDSMQNMVIRLTPY